jgi:hypothetical protein
MRHAIVVVGSKEQDAQPVPKLALRDDEPVRTLRWYACTRQADPSRLLDDVGNVFLRILLVPVLAYQFHLLVQNTKLWAGKRPLVLIRGRSLSSRVAAFAARWGGGDIVKADLSDEPPLSRTRFVLAEDGSLKLYEG